MLRLAGIVTVVAATAVVLGGCRSLASSAAGDLAGNLSTAILNQDDPELVRESLPAYLLLLDSLAASPDASPQVLGAAARLYAAYAVVFVADPARAGTLATRARSYGARAACAAGPVTCDLQGVPYPELAARLDRVKPAQSAALFSGAVGSLAYVRTHSDDWQALADLPRIEAVLKRLLVIGDPADAGTVNSYLGILTTLRPPALGGQPEQGRAYFEKAIELTGGRDLSVLVEFARSYARLVYDRELHDSLLNRALAADPRQEGYTLLNTLAQKQASELLASANDYF
ncbi:MAG: TRAP transporter TatT component family protein [Gammaproteobacteria bacterium]|nr:TRAP transporter TatT component family protein [Gammaproteobacteria bacterium]